MKKKKTNYEILTEARMVLGLPERATFDEVKEQYHKLIRIWHPDKITDSSDEQEDKSKEIIEAYKILHDYCKNFRIPFVKNDADTDDDFDDLWDQQFGYDPMWGPPPSK